MKHSLVGAFMFLCLLAPVLAQNVSPSPAAGDARGAMPPSDPVITLQEIIALALDQNYDVRLARNLEYSAQTDDKYSVGGLLPVINATGSRVFNNNDQKQTLQGGVEVERNGVRTNNLAASVAGSWLIFDGTRMFATRERLEQLAAQGMINVKDQMVNTISDVLLNYYNVIRQKQQLKAVREQMVLSEERVRLADRRLAVGTGAKPELLQAKVDLNSQRTAMIQQETTIAQLKDQLNGLVNHRLPETFDVADTIIIDMEIRQEDIAAKTEVGNFALQSSKLGVEIATLSVRERKGERYPFISLNGAYNFTRNENEVVINNFTPLFNRNRGFNYGLSMSFPILNGFTNRREVQKARINLDRSRLLYDQARVNTDVMLKNAYTAYDNAKKMLVIEEENIGLAKENIYIALESFKRSANTFIEVRTAQQSLADAYNRLINARYLAKVAEIELLRVSGQLLQER